MHTHKVSYYNTVYHQHCFQSLQDYNQIIFGRSFKKMSPCIIIVILLTYEQLSSCQGSFICGCVILNTLLCICKFYFFHNYMKNIVTMHERFSSEW